MTSDIINLEDLKSRMFKVVSAADDCPVCGAVEDCHCDEEQKRLDKQAFQCWKEFEAFLSGEMEIEDEGDYLNAIGFNVIFSKNLTPVGLIGTTYWGWFDTLNCAAHFIIGNFIKTVPIPPIEEWSIETTGILEDCANYCIDPSTEGEFGTVQDHPDKNNIC